MSGVSPATPQVGAPGVFHDVAGDWGLLFHHFNGMSGKLYFAEMTGGGAALLDYDRDGDLDVYYVQGTPLGETSSSDWTVPARYPEPLSDRLFRNDTHRDAEGTVSMTFADVTETSGLPTGGYGMGVTAGDYDGDGWPDLYITNFGGNRLLRNQGDGTFEDATATAGVDDRSWSVAAAFVDVDRDGWLDLYVGNYVDYRLATHRPCYSDTGALDYCGPRSYPHLPDRLFRNRGDGTFEDISRRSGVGVVPGAALGVAVADFNADGWSDLYVANDGAVNFLWMNQGDGTFVDEALLSGTAVNADGQPEASMGVVAADLDGNGADDLFMAHLTRETNTLYLNDGQGFFAEATQQSGLGLPSWQYTGFGVGTVDFDRDGDLDLFVANGAVKHLEALLQEGDVYPLRQTNQLFRNLGSGRFEEVPTAEAGEALSHREVSRGVAVGDLDNDGDDDLVVVNNAGPSQVLEATGTAAGWLGVALDGLPGSRALGSSGVAVTAAGERRRAHPKVSGSFASSGDPRVVVWTASEGASGSASALEWVRADGSRLRWLSPAASRYYVPFSVGMP